MKTVSTFASILCAFAASPMAAAAPVDFECDVPPNRASYVDQAVPGPGAAVSGVVSFVLARGGRFSPSGSVKVADGADGVHVALQMIGVAKSALKEDAPPGSDYYSIYMLTRGPAGQSRKLLGKLAPTSANLPFSVGVTAEGLASVKLGALGATAKLAPLGAMPRARVLCSGGQFSFKGIEAR